MHEQKIVYIRTSTLLYRDLSERSRAISVPMYHPLNGAAVYSSPPQSNIIPLTAGRPYHLRPSSSNQGYLYK